MKNNGNKNKNKNISKKSVRRTNVVRDRLYKTINPVSQKTSAVITVNETFQTKNASPLVTFSTGDTYLNLSSIYNNGDFLDTADSFLYMRINKIVFDITRSTDESSILASLHGSDIYINYIPSLVSTTVSYGDLSRDINSYRIDPMTFNEQKVVCLVPDLISYNLVSGVDHWLNPGKLMNIAYTYATPGSVCINTGNSTNNTGVSLLYVVRVKFHIDFFHRK